MASHEFLEVRTAKKRRWWPQNGAGLCAQGWTSGEGREVGASEKEVQIAGGSVRGVRTAREERKNGCCPSFASMREKGRERVGTATQQFESGRKRS